MIPLITRRKTSLIVISLTLVFAIFALIGPKFVNWRNYMKQSNFQKSLRVAFETGGSVKQFDPARVQTLTDAIIVFNLFGSLVEFDSAGRLVTNLAENFITNDSSVVFEFSQKAKTPSGAVIGAEDAYFSLKRLMVLGSSTHGNLCELLCGKENLKSINDTCVGMAIVNQKLVLTPINKLYTKFLPSILAAPDFRILQKQSVDWTDSKLPIIDYENTSGAYYVKKDDVKGNYLWQANPNYPFYTPKIPQMIEVVSATFDTIEQLLIDEKIDMLPTDFILKSDVYDRIKNNLQLPILETRNICVKAYKFSKKAIKKFTASERFFIAQKIIEYLNNSNPSKSLYTDTVSFFQDNSEGGLDQEQLEQVKIARSKATPPKGDVEFAVYSAFQEKWKGFFPQNPNFKKRVLQKHAGTLPSDQRPDVFFSAGDTSFFEDISLISYNFKMDFWGMSRKESEAWFNDYIATEDRSARIEKLQKLHFWLLKEGILVPFSAGPYTVVLRKPWQMELSPFYAHTSLWHVTWSE